MIRVPQASDDTQASPSGRPAPGPAAGAEELPPTLRPGAIFQAAPPRKPGLSILITLNVYAAMVLAALAWGRLRQAEAEAQRRIETREEVTLVFEPDAAPPSLAPGSPRPDGSPARTAPDGTGTLDPAQVTLDPARLQGFQAEDVQEVPTTLPREPQAFADVSLPVAVGGNGVAAGSGSGSGHGIRLGAGGTMFRAVPGLSQDLNLADLDVIHEEIPDYPLLAALSNIQGDVVVRVTINEHGVPIRTELLEGPPQLCPVTMRAVKHWRFGKGIFRGRKVNATFDMTFRFILRPR